MLSYCTYKDFGIFLAPLISLYMYNNNKDFLFYSNTKIKRSIPESVCFRVFYSGAKSAEECRGVQLVKQSCRRQRQDVFCTERQIDALIWGNWEEARSI